MIIYFPFQTLNDSSSELMLILFFQEYEGKSCIPPKIFAKYFINGKYEIRLCVALGVFCISLHIPILISFNQQEIEISLPCPI